jgi:tetratricopeptide (TPR) repeat protein
MKVFLSSTYLDLIEHRKAVVNALRTMGEEVEHMEIFGARNEEPTQASLIELDNCDVLVGVYAYRYGTVPKGTKASVTEQEYLHATSKKIPILVFIVNEDHEWSPKKMDENLLKIKKFKSKASSDHSPAYFTTPDNLASQVVTAIGRLAKKLGRAPASTSSNSEPRKPPTGSTLPSQPYFFGREKELKDINEALEPNIRAWGALIYGPGGIGKTALAIRAADLASTTLFERKLFITAKIRELTPEGEKTIADFTRDNYFSILNELALELGEGGISRLAPDERANTLRLSLAGKKTLIVIDNLETLNNDDRTRIFQFLSRLPQGNKAIVTSRRRDDAEARIIQLDQLQEPEAEELISELVKSNPRLNNISDSEKKELFYSATGNPLLIRWILGQVGREGSSIKTISDAIKFMRQAPPGNDPLEYVFGDLLNSLIPSEKIVLATMTYLSDSPRSEWISEINKLSTTTVEMIWEELVNRSILVANKDAKGYFLPYVTSQFVNKKLPREISDVEKRLAEYGFRKTVEFGGRKSFKEQKNLAKYWPVISASLPYFVKHDNNALQTLCETLDMFLKSNGLWDEWLWLNQQAELVALVNDDYDTAGERAYKVGLIYSYLGKPNDILRYATRAEKHWQEIKATKLSIKGKTLVSHLRGISYKLSGNYPKAIEIINNALDIWNETDPEGIEVAATLNTLGEIQVKEGEMTNAKDKFVDAERNFEEAIRIALKNEQREGKEGIAIYKGNLANLALKQGNWQKVEALASDALRLAEELGLQDEIARENLHLAIAYLNLGYGGPRGLDASQKAVQIYKRLRHKDLPDAEAILREWEK